jgi:hypothetical protein
MELYLPSPNIPSWCGAQLKHRDNFTFTPLSLLISCKISFPTVVLKVSPLPTFALNP